MATRHRRSTPAGNAGLAQGQSPNAGMDSVSDAQQDEESVRLHGAWRPADRDARIAARAYELAQARNFQPGHELDDWLAAERQVDSESESQMRAE